MPRLSELLKPDNEGVPAVPKRERKKYSPDELRIKVMSYLIKRKQKYADVLKHLPLSWGGTLRAGGGWSGAFLKLIEIIAEVV